MNKVQILDCTLRDGGYCNQWDFGYDNQKKIVNGLIESNVEIVECGFLTNKAEFDEDKTKFTSLQTISRIIPSDRKNCLFVAMMNYGEYNVDELPDYDGTSIDGIRVAFHKKDWKEALVLCGKIKDKGYKVFIQAMVSLNYSDVEFLDVINTVNKFSPYAFYIVDSFGMMKGKDLTRLFYLVEHNLDSDIKIGFHSHNNMQLSFSNAQLLLGIQTNRNLIIDASVYGMGRGAGNLNTEIILDYLNEASLGQYNIKPLFRIIDEILCNFYEKESWGYSLPNYLSASYNVHPNYASYLDDKKTLTIEAMDVIFKMIDKEKKNSYDRDYIEDLYLQYMASEKNRSKHEFECKNAFKDKTIVLIAPGKSSVDEKEKIIDFLQQKDAVCVSVNHVYKETVADYIFISNLRRYRELPNESRGKAIVTSNIVTDIYYCQTKYYDLLNDVECVRDNAGLMAIKFFINCGAKEICLAGFDGYSHDIGENYAYGKMKMYMKDDMLDAINEGMIKVIDGYKKEIRICFLTSPKHIF